LGSDDPGEAGDDDVVDRVFFQQSHQGDVIQIQVALAGMESDTGYPVPLRVAKRVRIGSLGYNERDPLTDDSMLQQRLDMSTDIRTEELRPGYQGRCSGSTPKRLPSSVFTSRGAFHSTARARLHDAFDPGPPLGPESGGDRCELSRNLMDVGTAERACTARRTS